MIEKLNDVKSERDDAEVRRCLKRLEKEVKAGRNLVPALIECAKAYVTIGEMCGILGKEWGYYQEGALWI